MNITLPIFLVGAVTGSVLMVADAPPKFNVESGCKEAVALDQSMDTDPGVSQNYQSCMNDETSAHEELVQSWSKYSAADKTRCVGQTEVGGMPSYVEVLECLLTTVNVGNPVPPMENAASPDQQQPLVGVKKAKQQQKKPPQKQ